MASLIFIKNFFLEVEIILKHLIKYKDGVDMGLSTVSLRILMSLCYLERFHVCTGLHTIHVLCMYTSCCKIVYPW